MLKEGTDEFHVSLAQMPTYTGVNWSYAVDMDTVKSKPQLMMGLVAAREKLGYPLLFGRMLIPSHVAMWNHLKGRVDDFSKVLAHALSSRGKISTLNVIWIRLGSTCWYNAWHLNTMQGVFVQPVHTERRRRCWMWITTNL